MNYTVITGMSKSYFDNIGKTMLESWITFWPENFHITVYTEDLEELKSFKNTKINFVSLDTFSEGYREFQKKDFRKLNSRVHTFSKKAWPIMENLKSNSGKLIWIDADVITEDYINIDWLESLLDDKQFSAHIGVIQSTYYSVETGFFIINLENKFKDQFFEEYYRIYATGDFSGMKKPFDGDTFGKVITLLKENKEFQFNDLSPSSRILSPFNRIFEGKMKHYKAKRKHYFNL